jgi:hypothetical protein
MLQVVNSITFRIGQPVEHPWCRFPANFAIGLDAPHRITGLFELGEDLCHQPLFREAGMAWSFSADFHLNPESEFWTHMKFHFLSIMVCFSELLSVSLN